MKLSTKIILPIILISALLILLNGCMGTVPDEEPGYTPGTINGIIASPCCSTSAEPVSETCCIAPEYWCFYCQKIWNLQDAIEVVLTYGEDEVATVFTNEDGEFTFTNVDPGKNYVITAYCLDFGDNRPLVKDVALELIEGGSFDTKITDLVSTSLGLVVDFLVLYTDWGPEDISLDAVLADRPSFPNFPKFKKLVYEVRRVVENCEVNLLTDDAVQDALCRAAEEISKLEIGCAPGATPPPPPPPPTPDPCDGNAAPVFSAVTIDGTPWWLVDGKYHVVVGNTYVITIIFNDNDGPNALTYTATVDETTYPVSSPNQITLLSGTVGEYSISLSAYDGCDTTTWGPVTVVVECPLPTADAGGPYIETLVCPEDGPDDDVTVSFSGSASGTGTFTYLWDFGDGNTSTEQNPTHTYVNRTAASYTVTLTVTGDGENACGSDTDETTVTINYVPCCPPPTSLDIVISSTNPPCDETFAYINSVTVSFDGKADETITPTYVGTGVVLSCTDTTNISIDQVTGEVELTTGAFDTYTITVTYTDPECGDPISDTVQVTFAECECGYCYSEDGNGCFTIESEASYDGTNTTFWFKICDLDGSDCAGLSHWVYGTETSAEFCIDASDIVSISPGYSSIDYDGSTGKYGIKWESSLPGDGECKEFTIVLKGCRVGDSGGDYMAILKYGNFYTTFDVCGPTCD